MYSKALFFVGIVIVSCLLGCNTSTKTQQMQVENRVLIHAGNLTRITGMQWILQKMTVEGQDCPLTGEKPYIKFEPDGKVSGFGSINRYFGSVQMGGEGNLKWSPLGSTKMAGPDELMKQEDMYLKALPLTEQMSVEGIHLYLSTKDEQIELIFFCACEMR